MSSSLEFRRSHIGRAVARLLWSFEAEINDAIRTAGFADFRNADAQVIRCLPSEGGASVVELAGRVKISKQAMSKQVGSLEKRGYVRRRADPTDARAKVVTLTAKGRRLLEAGGKAIAGLERRWSKVIGKQRFAELKSSLLELGDEVAGPDYV